jgi:hypothetical protein
VNRLLNDIGIPFQTVKQDAIEQGILFYLDKRHAKKADGSLGFSVKMSTADPKEPG